MGKTRSRPPERRLYADAEPFARAIDEWMRRRYCEQGVAVSDRRTTRGSVHAAPIPNLQLLAELCRCDSRQLARIRHRHQAIVELDLADRIALGLDIPLWMLAEEFHPLRHWHPRPRKMKVAA